jgi:hypothetical protein
MKADVEKYRAKTQAVIQTLNELLEALKDNEISNEECDMLIAKVSELF